jgi:putative ABC transport system ATP-binding protein
MNLLSASNIAHSFEYELFSNVSLDLYEKESIAIIGVSGSGKSTLLHILSTLLQPQEGSVKILQKDIATLKEKELAKLRREALGLVFQSHYLFKGFSAYENLEVAEILAQKPIKKELLEALEIEHCIHQKVTELSGGQQQRVSIARVLTKQPRLIFADEPTGNLDGKTARDVMKLFFSYIKEHNAAMVLVSHDEDLAHMCDKVYRLQNKELVQVK